MPPSTQCILNLALPEIGHYSQLLGEDSGPGRRERELLVDACVASFQEKEFSFT